MCTRDYESAILQDLASLPASMKASSKIDCCGCSRSHQIQQADAQKAFFAAELTRPKTWIWIPGEAWPSHAWNSPDGVLPDDPKAKAVRTPKYDGRVCCVVRVLHHGHP